METQSFDSADVDRIESFVSDLYSKLRIGAVGTHARARVVRRDLSPELGFDDSNYGFEFSYRGEPADRIIIGEVLSETLDRTTEGRGETFQAGDLFLLSRPGQAYQGVVHAARQRVTVLDPALLNRVAAPATKDARPVQLLDTRPVSPAAAQHLQRSIAHLRDNVLSIPEAAGSSLVVSTATQYLAASVLNAFPNTALNAPTAQDHHDGHPVTVRRAIAYIETHLAADIDLVDIATAAHVSPRALQYAFRRHLGMTPMAYLRRARLDAAHRDLLVADPTNGATVTGIATTWGFSYPSRFAAIYRKAFGQHPQATLHA